MGSAAVLARVQRPDRPDVVFGDPPYHPKPQGTRAGAAAVRCSTTEAGARRRELATTLASHRSIQVLFPNCPIERTATGPWAYSEAIPRRRRLASTARSREDGTLAATSPSFTTNAGRRRMPRRRWTAAYFWARSPGYRQGAAVPATWLPVTALDRCVKSEEVVRGPRPPRRAFIAGPRRTRQLQPGINRFEVRVSEAGDTWLRTATGVKDWTPPPPSWSFRRGVVVARLSRARRWRACATSGGSRQR